MKKTLLTLTLSLLIVAAFGQDIREAIKYEGKGIIEFKDGTKAEGEIVYEPFRPDRVKCKTDGAEKATTYKIKVVSKFTAGEYKYFNRSNKGAIGGDEYFVQIISNESYKIKLYMYEQQRQFGTDDGYEVETTYYIEFPGQENLIALNDLKLSPFHKKMPKYITDCDELTKKIAKKDKKYKVGMMTTPKKKVEILKMIIEEYENCGK